MPTHPAHHPNAKKEPQHAPMVPFLQGTYEYTNIQETATFVPGSTQQDHTVELNPGGWLRGVSLYITSASGAASGGTVNADNPFNLFQTMLVESIDGAEILYPLGGFAYYLVARYCRPWDGNPAMDATYSSGINPAFRMRFFLESRATLGVLANTDARAQYRLRYTIAPLASLYSGGTISTPPTVTIVTAIEEYAQPPVATLSNQHIEQVPEGTEIQRFVSHDAGIPTTTGDTTQKINRVGNLQRTQMLVFRDSSGNRIDLTADPIRWRIDNTDLLIEQRARRDFEMSRFYSTFGPPAPATGQIPNVLRPTGVYVYPRWTNPGVLDGMGWLETTEATFEQYEYQGGPSGGSLEIITEDLAPTGPAIQPHLQDI